MPLPHLQTPPVTPKYHIETTGEARYVKACVYKVVFGSKFYIGKGKSYWQSLENMAILIERGIRLKNSDPSDQYHHIITYVNRNRVIKAKASLLSGDEISGFDALKMEQELLDKHKNDPDCLNNSFDAYIPKWIKAEEAQQFNEWKSSRAPAKKRKRSSDK